MLQIRTVQVNLGEEKLPLLVAGDIESLIGDINDPDQTPCWAEVWPAAVGLARFIREGPDLSGKTVLELGAGVGLPGVVCGLKGAAVTFSDFQPQALELCERNARMHNLGQYRLLKEDWRYYSNRERFDLVLASDIAYEPRLLPSLKKVLLHTVTPGGVLYLTHAGRPVTFKFVEELLNEGFCSVENSAIVVETDDSLRSIYRINIHQLAG